MKNIKKSIGFAVLVLTLMVGFGSTVLANHSWGEYHWARTSNPFTLKLGDNVSGVWDSHLVTTSNDWSLSSVLNTTIVSGLSSPRTCKPILGRVEVCNSKYGNNGWLGIAQIWISSGNHITQAVTKMNDTYFSRAPYNTSAWRNLVMCQEVGHVFGLDHQDENFNNTNLGTCMDYTNDPNTNQYPNSHDYSQLESIYSHLDTTTTVNAVSSGNNRDSVDSDPSSWGRAVAQDYSGKNSKFEKDLGNGNKVITHVFWAE